MCRNFVPNHIDNVNAFYSLNILCFMNYDTPDYRIDGCSLKLVLKFTNILFANLISPYRYSYHSFYKTFSVGGSLIMSSVIYDQRMV